MAKKTVLISGITGVAGRHAAQFFLEQGMNVVGFSRNAESSINTDELDIEVFNLDLKDFVEKKASISIEEVDLIYHTAANVLSKTIKEKENMYTVNVDATLKLYSWAADNGVKDFIFLSSVSIYDYPKNNERIREDHPKKPRYYYAFTKLEAENKLLKLYNASVKKEKEPKLTILRPCYIVGKGDRNFAPQFIGRLLNKKLPVIGSGENLVSFVHAKDLALAALHATKRKEHPPEAFNVVSFEKGFIEFFKPIAEYFGVQFPVKRYPYYLAYTIGLITEITKKIMGKDPSLGISTYRVKTLSKNRIYDVSKIESLGFKPQYGYDTVFKEIISDVEENPQKYGL